jgi:hypothetical protein
MQSLVSSEFAGIDLTEWFVSINMTLKGVKFSVCKVA